MKRTATIFLAFMLCISLNAEDRIQDSINTSIFNRVYKAVGKYRNAGSGKLISEIALQFLGTPYEGGTLEKEPEELRVYLDKTDCILFVEMCASFALTVKSDNPCYETLKENIRQMRYRNGAVNGYASRIHYTSEWLAQNESRGILHEYSDENGERFNQKFSFMSSHPELYVQLKDNPDAVAGIKAVEDMLNGSGPWWKVPQPDIPAADIRTGDIVCRVSGVDGLDIAHVMIALVEKGNVRFIHASSKGKKVMISDDDIIKNSPHGFRLARLY